MAKRANAAVVQAQKLLTLTEEQAISIVNDLRGTPGNLDMEIQGRLGNGIGTEDLDTESLDIIDEHIFNCEVCGWWCDNDEMSHDQGICEECFEPDDEEEDEDSYEDRMNYPMTDEDYYRDEPEDL